MKPERKFQKSIIDAMISMQWKNSVSRRTEVKIWQVES